MQGSCHIGTSGWSYAGWKGLFYPADLPARSFLEYYVQSFDTVELNASFYHLPKGTSAKNWHQNTPENFFLCPKLSRYITHIKRLNEFEEPLDRFFHVFDLMQDKIGPVLVQIPPSLKFEPEIAEPFYAHLKKKYRQYRFAMEVRHLSWMEKESYDLMTKYNIAFVISQSGGFFPYAEVVTTDVVYVRFHGPGSLYSSNYSHQYLRAFANKIERWMEEGRAVWCFFNNDIKAFAPYNAIQLKKYVGQDNK